MRPPGPVPLQGGQPPAFDRRQAQTLPDQRPVHADTRSLHQVEGQTTGAEQNVERVEPRGQVVALDPGYGRLWHARRARQLTLRQARTSSCVPENRTSPHGRR